MLTVQAAELHIEGQRDSDPMFAERLIVGSGAVAVAHQLLPHCQPDPIEMATLHPDGDGLTILSELLYRPPDRPDPPSWQSWLRCFVP